MGGTAFSGIGHTVERMDRETYFKVRDEILTILDMYAGFRFRLVQELPDKESFGDIDFFIESKKEDILPELQKVFGVFDSTLKRNGDVISVLFRQKYQIDFIVMDYKHFRTASLFYDYNDVGNLIGRLYRHYGFKLTPKGLFYPIIHNKHGVIGEVEVSTSQVEILGILGLTVHDYLSIQNRESLFVWLSNSPFFVKTIYALDKLSNANRRRDKKRPTYTAFLEWLEGREFPQHNLTINVTEIDSSIAVKIAEIITNYSHNLEISSKFNGRKFLERGVDPKRIGEFKKFIHWGYSREYLICVPNEEADLIIDALIKYDAKYSLKIMYESN